MLRLLNESISRFSALTTPVVSVWSRPNGLPMANTFWPTIRSRLVPTGIGGSLELGASIFSTARSRSGKAPTSLASKLVWSAIVTRAAFAPWITW